MPPLNPDAEVRHRPSLPLFRPEALAAQQRSQGEILLIRPLSLIFFGWLGIGVAGMLFGYLALGHYTERARAPAFLTPHPGRVLSSTGQPLEAFFYFPAQWLPFVKPGNHMTLYCQGCADPAQALTGTVMEVMQQGTDATAAPGIGQDVTYKATMTLPAQLPYFTYGSFAAPDLKLSVEISLGRKRLMHWLVASSAKSK
jgi:hypothetical protein